jgi:tRNA(fMet)-specific endonuclease VapC
VLYMFDTNVLSEHLKGNPRIVDRANEVEPEDQTAIANIVWFEIIRGRIAAMTTADNVNQLLTAQSRFDRDLEKLARFAVYGVAESVAERFESLRTKKKCKRMDRTDLLIACIALGNNGALVTRNVKDFANVPGLQLQTGSTNVRRSH